MTQHLQSLSAFPFNDSGSGISAAFQVDAAAVTIPLYYQSPVRPGNGIADANLETSSQKPCLKKAKTEIPHSVHAQ